MEREARSKPAVVRSELGTKIRQYKSTLGA